MEDELECIEIRDVTNNSQLKLDLHLNLLCAWVDSNLLK